MITELEIRLTYFIMIMPYCVRQYMEICDAVMYDRLRMFRAAEGGRIWAGQFLSWHRVLKLYGRITINGGRMVTQSH